MEEKQIRKIRRYLEDAIDGKDDLLQSTETLINTANLQVQTLLNTQVSLCQKEAVLKYLTKIVALFTDLNFSVLKFLETEPLPAICEVGTDLTKPPLSPSIQDLTNFVQANLHESISRVDYSTHVSKILNNPIEKRDDCVKKSLENETVSKEFLSSTAAVETEANRTITNSVIQEHHEKNKQFFNSSPSVSMFGDSEVFSTVSSTNYQHPLTKFKTPCEIPPQYDAEHLKQIKENLSFISEEMKNKFKNDFPKSNFHYEEPVKEVQNEKNTPIPKEEILLNTEKNTATSIITTSTEESTLGGSSTDPDRNNWPGDMKTSEGLVDEPNNQNGESGPSKSTGSTRKQQILADNLIEFSGSASGSETSEKVNTWLKNNILPVNKTQEAMVSNSSDRQNSALEKLKTIKRFDRNEEAREKARNNMPDLKLIPVEVPPVIKNDCNSDSNSSGKRSTGKKKKANSSNGETAVYEIKKMAIPQVKTACVFSHIVSPSEFYLQVVDESSSAYLDMVTEKLEEKFKKSQSVFKTKKEAFEKLGKFCFGYVWHNKQAWYRLQVVDWELGCPSEDVLVQSVDYGFQCRTSFKDLREMTTDLAHIPMLAIKCHLPFLYPPESTYTNRLNEWPQDTVESLYDIVNLHDDMDTSDLRMFEIIFAKLEGDSLALDLVAYGEPEADSLGEMLVDCGLATEIIDDYEGNPELGHFLEDVRDLENADNLNELIVGYDAQDEKRICKFGTNCFKGKNCRLEHINLKDGFTTDKTTVFYTAINKLIFPIKGEIVQVLVTGYIDSCCYLVQMVRSSTTKETNGLVMDKGISDLMDAMNHPKVVMKYEKFKVYPAVGEIILAYYPLSKMWLRVAVRELKFDNNGDIILLEVFSVDFGDMFTVKMKDTRVMKEDFMHLPFQVIQIYLDKYQHNDGCDPKKARRFFDKHIFYKNFLAQIQSNDSPFKVNLTTFKGREIGPTLMKEGFAEKRSRDIYIVEGDKMDLE